MLGRVLGYKPSGVMLGRVWMYLRLFDVGGRGVLVDAEDVIVIGAVIGRHGPWSASRSASSTQPAKHEPIRGETHCKHQPIRGQSK